MRTGRWWQAPGFENLMTGQSAMISTKTNEVQIVVNGQVRLVPEGRSLLELLSWLNIAPDRVAIELDRRIIRRQDWEQTIVLPGAALEIVQFVGGG